MAIIVGDIHGNVEKVKAFLAYKPEVEHLALGDYVDSFTEPVEQQVECLQLLLDSKTILLWGNHDLHYLSKPPFICTGYQYKQDQIYRDLIEDNKYRFKAAYAVDSWLCTHAGLAKWLANDVSGVNVLADVLNDQLAEWLADPCETAEGIFAIGKSRGGSGKYSSGGIFWFDFKREGDLIAKVKQIFGHTETPKPVVTENFVTLDTTNNNKDCWLFDAKINELVRLDLPERKLKTDSKVRTWNTEIVRLDSIEFALEHPESAGWTPTADGLALLQQHRPEVILQYRLMRTPRLRDLPPEEQEPFRKWLEGQTVPLIDGIAQEDQDFFYQYDYDRWKKDHDAWNM